MSTQAGVLPPKPDDALPDSTERFGPCPRCERLSNFKTFGHPLPVTLLDHTVQIGPQTVARDHVERISVLTCMGCGQNVVVLEEEFVGGKRWQEGLNSGTIQWRGIHWWPSPGMQPANQDVPAAVGDAMAEGTRCLAVQAPRAAVVMFRGVLAEIVADKGSSAAKGKNNLAAQLKQMATDGDLQPTLADWADHIRLIGNAGAHPSTLAPVSGEEAAELARLLISMLDYLYVMPAKITRSRAARTPSAPPSVTPPGP
ncbi:DUF4145 domain-containing protein [Amycolatopsis sp. NBC_00348]|uniref:DUF4145 domain-containing protein n=1 Tax=Amycolatopsis sp. NBC_00348 TaxID=2975956 RepID=UPI002E276A40